MNIILGTASLGTAYGIANGSEKISTKKALDLLTSASNLGINKLDTAPSYLNSHQIIGEHHLTNEKFSIYTKIPESVNLNLESCLDSVQKSIKDVGVESLEAVYFHSFSKLMGCNLLDAQKAIEGILSSGLVSKVGASVYTENEIIQINEKFPKIKLFQVPENIADRRLLKSRKIKELSESGYEFHVRSVFLQGLLLMKDSDLPNFFQEARERINQFRVYAEKINISLVELCMNYSASINWATSIVVGVNSSKQITEVASFTKTELDFVDFPDCLPEKFLDPRNWPIL